MNTNNNNQHYDWHSSEQTNRDFNILEPAPDIDLILTDDDEDELSDYTLLDIANDPDYEDNY
jgi:hypothetical protein